MKKNYLTILTKKGLGRSLLTLLLVSALLPMGIVSWIHYQNSKEVLLKNAHSRLHEGVSAEARQLTNYFNDKIANLTMLSEMQINISFMQELISSFAESNRDIGGFTRSYAWSVLAETGSDLALFRRTFAIHDILLLDTHGNILFTVAEEDDLGQNLFTGALANSKFSKMAQKTNVSGRVSFADYDHYSFTDSTKSYAFLIAPVLDENGDRLGIMAFQLIGDDIDALLNVSLGDKGEIFLISEGGRRSNCKLDSSKRSLDPTEETAMVKVWREHLLSKNSNQGEHLQIDEEIMAYKGHLGNQVLGLHRSLLVANTNFALIAEIDQEQVLALAQNLRQTVFQLFLVTSLIAFVLVIIYARTLVEPILRLVSLTQKVARGNYELSTEVKAKYELAELATNFKIMQDNLRKTIEQEKLGNWQKNGIAGLNNNLQGEHELATLASGVSSYLAEYLQAQVGAFYINERDTLVFSNGYAFKMRDDLPNSYAMGEGLVGQAGKGKKTIQYPILTLDQSPLTVNSGLGESRPAAVIAVPLLYEGQIVGVFELGRIKQFTKLETVFLEEAMTYVAIALNTAMTRRKTNDLLMITQAQSEELQSQQEELKSSNEELEEQAANLQRSQLQLQEQSEELKASNEELEEKTERLQHQKQEITKAKEDVDQKAQEIAAGSKYKSEFLANMSHELRSPLNSLLILSQSLADNDDGNLTDEQVEEAGIIHNSGTELLNLINDILDLSKVEAGQLIIHDDEIYLTAFCDNLIKVYSRQATAKGLSFHIEYDKSIPDFFRSDEQRLGQILKNLISNALKFTAAGEILLQIYSATDTIAFAVKDTGIGIAPEKQKAIFQAFQQADGSTTRKYGGTGLGLTISRKLATLLGGSIELESVADQGSTFTLSLPTLLGENEKLAPHKKCLPKTMVQQEPLDVEDSNINTEHLVNKTILVVDDDMRNTFALGNLLKKEGLQVILAADGQQALDRLKEHGDIDLVLMDIMMPNMDGYEAITRIRAMEDQHDLAIIALTVKSMEDDRQQCLAAGANEYLTKPVGKDALLTMISELLA